MLKIKNKMFLCFVLILAMCFFVACSKENEKGQSENNAEVNKIYNPFTGLVVKKMPAKPLVVSIDNNPDARPQTGLSQADIVYEIPAEGGISRYVAVFYGQKVDVIGPVRSSRPYIIDVARQWDALFVHAGGSNDAYVYLKKKVVDYLDEIYNSKYFWRDKSRKAPHNLYTSTALLAEAIADKGYKTGIEVEAYVWSEEAPAFAEPAAWVKIYYPSAKVEYEYDEASGLYLRYLKGDPCLDKGDGEQWKAANVVVQRVSSKVLDSEGRLEINLVGSGKAWLLRDGVVQEGTWKRTSPDSMTRYYDSNGNEWSLKPGQTWIQMIDQNVKFTLPEE